MMLLPSLLFACALLAAGSIDGLYSIAWPIKSASSSAVTWAKKLGENATKSLGEMMLHMFVEACYFQAGCVLCAGAPGGELDDKHLEDLNS